MECLGGYVGPVTGSCSRRRARTIGHNYIAVTGSRDRRRATTRALQNMQLSSDATSKAQLNHPDVPHSMQHAYALYPRSTLRCNPDRATRYSMQRATCNAHSHHSSSRCSRSSSAGPARYVLSHGTAWDVWWCWYKHCNSDNPGPVQWLRSDCAVTAVKVQGLCSDCACRCAVTVYVAVQ